MATPNPREMELAVSFLCQQGRASSNPVNILAKLFAEYREELCRPPMVKAEIPCDSELQK